jgi:hypothetical protein
MWQTRIKTPVASSDRDKVHLCVDDATTNRSSNFLGCLDTKSNVSVAIADSNVALEASALTSSGLFLDRHDLHNLVFQASAKQMVNNLILLDGQREEKDLLNRLDLALLD